MINSDGGKGVVAVIVILETSLHDFCKWWLTALLIYWVNSFYSSAICVFENFTHVSIWAEQNVYIFQN